MNNNLNYILQECTNGLSEIFDDKLKQVILYGSHARGDFDSESDIDVMVLVEMSDEHIMEYRERVTELGAEISFKNDIMLSIIVKDIEHFNSWLPVYPFYKVIKKEGVGVFG